MRLIDKVCLKNNEETMFGRGVMMSKRRPSCHFDVSC